MQQQNREGIYLIDKESGWTSHDVVAKMRTITGIKKIGHAGTLDPLATGLLIVLVGREFTKRQDEFMKQDKSYVCKAKLGVTTDTYDIDGSIVDESNWLNVKSASRRTNVKEVIKKYVGEIEQTVPAFSAVSVGGERLYKKARKGVMEGVELPSRRVLIHGLRITDYEVDDVAKEAYVTFEVSCGSGTYIRSLVHDIGQDLGIGATVAELRRTRIGDFKVDDAVTIGTIADSAK